MCDDPFDQGFNKGYEEFDCDIPDINDDISQEDYLAVDGSPFSTRTQGTFLNPTDNLRISAIKICNSGYPRLDLAFAPFKETFLGFVTDVQERRSENSQTYFPQAGNAL